MPESQLTVEKLSYGGFGPVSFELAAGEIIGIFGESGCGKTRLLRAVADLDPHAGRVALKGVNAVDIPPNLWRRKVAFLPSESQWWFDSAALHFKQPPSDNELARLGLKAEILRAQVSHLSSGEKQRLALLRVLQNNPEVLLLDEITAHLDHERTLVIELMIQELQQRDTLSVIWISHNREQLQRVSGRIFVMEERGRIRT